MVEPEKAQQLCRHLLNVLSGRFSKSRNFSPLRTVIFTPIERLWSPLTESQQPVCLNRNYLHKTKNKLSRKINFMLMLIQMSSTHSRLFSLFRLLGRILILKITQFISWSTYIKGSPHHSPWRWLLNTGSTELLISPRSGAEVAKPDWRWRFHHSFSIHDSNRVWESKYLLIKSSFRHYHFSIFPFHFEVLNVYFSRNGTEKPSWKFENLLPKWTRPLQSIAATLMWTLSHEQFSDLRFLFAARAQIRHTLRHPYRNVVLFFFVLKYSYSILLVDTAISNGKF